MDFDKIISDLKNKVYHPVYFLMGEEPYFIDEVSNYIEKHILDDSEKEFNQTILYGGETTILQVISEAKSYPMMSNYRVVIIKEAQNMKDLVPKEKKSEGEKGRKEEAEKVHPLLAYLAHPQKSTILVFCHKYKTIDMRTSIGKIIDKKAVALKSEAIKEWNVSQWIESFLKTKKYSIEPKASQMLTAFLGNDLSKIVNELEKLFINISEKSTITPDHIQQYIGISKEYNNFELQDAIGKRDVLKANQIINYFASNPKDNPIIMTIALLGGYFTKMLICHHLKDKNMPPNSIASALKVSPYIAGKISQEATNYPRFTVHRNISLLREYDLRAKGMEGSGADGGELLKELIFRLIH